MVRNPNFWVAVKELKLSYHNGVNIYIMVSNMVSPMLQLKLNSTATQILDHTHRSVHLALSDTGSSARVFGPMLGRVQH